MTAVNWMIDQLLKKHVGKVGNEYVEIFEQAKEMEKQQIIDAYDQGDEDGYWHPENGYDKKFQSSDHYYNETYGSKGSDETKTDKI